MEPKTSDFVSAGVLTLLLLLGIVLLVWAAIPA
jgi:hypothetical protein